jgi:hypothetical protein
VLVDLEDVEGLVAVFGLVDLVAVPLEQRAHEEAGVLVVVHQQDARRPRRGLSVGVVEPLSEHALHLDQRGLPLSDPLESDLVQRPHAALRRDPA